MDRKPQAKTVPPVSAVGRKGNFFMQGQNDPISSPRRLFSVRLLVLVFLIVCLEVGHAGQAKAIDDPIALSTFEMFVQGWMRNLERVSRDNLSGIRLESSRDGYTDRYIRYGPEYQFRIKKTESAQTPYIGILTYPEKHMAKMGRTSDDARQTTGRVLNEIRVTEIFRFTNGRWVY